MPLLPLHQAHDYRALMARWRSLAGRLKVKLHTLTVLQSEIQNVKVHWLETGSGDEPVIYLSSGIHGDEAAAAWGLLIWAEENEARLRSQRFLIFPCLNPFGLMLNTRADHRGLDINRRFHVEDDDICGPWRRLMRGRAIRLGFCLHEDYDGQGCYVYELSHFREPVSQNIMAGLRSLPPDPRKSIDGSRAQLGVIRRKRVPNLPGLPEAIVLHQLGCKLTLTFETPSEFSFDDRIRAQVEFMNAVLSAVDIPE
ncbi:M14 family metallocarboxypeptidase [Prosthecobacter sp. SYSU 5D2]|uniref:M14 family metallopeptidase n=1 Tax=Prosthecobacter sp. SYSU 5D2 TaxID=3134134 RepID=UPI0031FF0029